MINFLGIRNEVEWRNLRQYLGFDWSDCRIPLEILAIRIRPSGRGLKPRHPKQDCVHTHWDITVGYSSGMKYPGLKDAKCRVASSSSRPGRCGIKKKATFPTVCLHE